MYLTRIYSVFVYTQNLKPRLVLILVITHTSATLWHSIPQRGDLTLCSVNDIAREVGDGEGAYNGEGADGKGNGGVSPFGLGTFEHHLCIVFLFLF